MRHECFTQRKLALLFILFATYIASTTLHAQVTIGSAEEPNSGALLDIKENGNKGANSTKGLLLPRMELSSINSMLPILDDSKIDDNIKKEHIGLTIFNLKDDYPNGLCKGVYVWHESFVWERIPEPCCLGLTDIEIENTVLHYIEDSSPEFGVELTPKEASTPITYNWYIDNKLFKTTQENSIILPMKKEYNEKDIFVTANNNCTTTPVTSTKLHLTVDTKCNAVEYVEIDRTDFNFYDNQEVSFEAIIVPIEATSPVKFEWFIGDRLITSGEDDASLIGTVEISDDGKPLKVRVTSCGKTVESESKILSVCKPITNLDITNNLYREEFKFASEREIIFTPVIAPEDPSGTLSYKWYLDKDLVSETDSYKKIFPKTSLGKEYYTLKLEVSSQCGPPAIAQKTIKIHDCFTMSDNQRITLEGGGEGTSTTDRSEWTFAVTDLKNYSPEQLIEMGVDVDWYYVNNNDKGPYTFTKINTDNSNEITVDVKNDGRFTYGTIYIGFIVKGSKNIFDCPMPNDKSNGVFKLMTQNNKVTQILFVKDVDSSPALLKQKWADFKP